MTIEYSQASSDDQDAIKGLLRELDGDRSNFNASQFIVAKYNGQLIGCVRVKVLSAGIRELASLAVAPKHRNQGVGSALVNKIIGIETVRPIYLLTADERKIFYQKFGFNFVGVSELPTELAREYRRIIDLPFAEKIKVVAMMLG